MTLIVHSFREGIRCTYACRYVGSSQLDLRNYSGHGISTTANAINRRWLAASERAIKYPSTTYASANINIGRRAHASRADRMQMAWRSDRPLGGNGMGKTRPGRPRDGTFRFGEWATRLDRAILESIHLKLGTFHCHCRIVRVHLRMQILDLVFGPCAISDPIWPRPACSALMHANVHQASSVFSEKLLARRPPKLSLLLPRGRSVSPLTPSWKPGSPS